jgi:hypothetical protein
MSLNKPYTELFNVLSQIIENYSKLEDVRDKESYRQDIVELYKEIYRSLRELSEKLQNCETTLIDSIAQLMRHMNEELVWLTEKTEFSDVYDELKERLAWNIYMPFWFASHAKSIKGEHSVKPLAEATAITGLLLFETREADDQLILECVKAIFSIVKDGFKKFEVSYGLDEPRLMLLVCYLGIVALNRGKENVVAEVKKCVDEFEKLYYQKYIANQNLPEGVDPKKVMGLPQKDQLQIELLRWRSDFSRDQYNSPRLMFDAEEKMYALIEEADIDRFIQDVWGISVS